MTANVANASNIFKFIKSHAHNCKLKYIILVNIFKRDTQKKAKFSNNKISDKANVTIGLAPYIRVESTNSHNLDLKI